MRKKSGKGDGVEWSLEAAVRSGVVQKVEVRVVEVEMRLDLSA